MTDTPKFRKGDLVKATFSNLVAMEYEPFGEDYFVNKGDRATVVLCRGDRVDVSFWKWPGKQAHHFITADFELVERADA